MSPVLRRPSPPLSLVAGSPARSPFERLPSLRRDGDTTKKLRPRALHISVSSFLPRSATASAIFSGQASTDWVTKNGESRRIDRKEGRSSSHFVASRRPHWPPLTQRKSFRISDASTKSLTITSPKPSKKLGRSCESISTRRALCLSSSLVGVCLAFPLPFDNLSLVGVCLAFPRLLLSVEGESDGDVELILNDLKRVFVGFDVVSCVEGNVDNWYQICCKVRLLYNLGCKKGKVGELMCKKKELFLECVTDDFVQKADFLCKFGVGKSNVGSLLLQSPEILNFDLETKVVSVLKLLKHFGLERKGLGLVTKTYPHVLGRNKMANTPNVMKALDLQDWCLEKLISSNGQLLATYNVASPDEDTEEEFINGLKRLESSRYPLYMTRKVDFMKNIGFGENVWTMKILNCLGGSSNDLQERFDCLLKLGISYSKICLSIKTSPKILNQSPELLEQKVNFLCGETGSSLDYITSFPAILCFDLNRMKFRCRFYVWLRESGLCKDYAIATMIATSEKAFISSLFGIHPAIPKQYLECFSNKRYITDDSEKLFSPPL